MGKAVKEFLTAINKREGYSIDDEALVETLVETGERVFSGYQDVHRWYITEEVVNEVEGRFIMFTDYIITGDNGMDDMDLSYDLEKAYFVEKKTREVTETYYE